MADAMAWPWARATRVHGTHQPPLFFSAPILATSDLSYRECVKRDLIRLCWAPMDLLACDALTKNLGTAKFRRFQRFFLNMPDEPAARTLLTHMISGFH